ncbi:hypothetical protein GF327_01975 [Candidatus Woesearchaeota archaeon]|nr:hypothetical protein [Candidatus Woesearchaeota archaeon]
MQDGSLNLATAPAIYSQEGFFESNVYEEQEIKEWGSIQIDYEKPEGTSINVLTRSSIDSLKWTDWQEVENFRIQSPDGNYLQYKLEFFTQDTSISPIVYEVRFYR